MSTVPQPCAHPFFGFVPECVNSFEAAAAAVVLNNDMRSLKGFTDLKWAQKGFWHKLSSKSLGWGWNVWVTLENSTSTETRLKQISYAGADVINKYKHSASTLSWNIGRWLVKNSHLTSIIQSECFISAYHGWNLLMTSAPFLHCKPTVSKLVNLETSCTVIKSMFLLYWKSSKV